MRVRRASPGLSALTDVTPTAMSHPPPPENNRTQTSAARRELQAMAWPQKLALARIIAAQAALQAGTRTVPIQTLRGLTRTLARASRAVPRGPKSALEIARLHALATTLTPFPVECVAESLALWLTLRSYGHPAAVQLGCRSIFGRLEAHAWVELDGATLNDPMGERDTWHAFDEPLLRGHD